MDARYKIRKTSEFLPSTLPTTGWKKIPRTFGEIGFNLTNYRGKKYRVLLEKLALTLPTTGEKNTAYCWRNWL